MPSATTPMQLPVQQVDHPKHLVADVFEKYFLNRRHRIVPQYILHEDVPTADTTLHKSWTNIEEAIELRRELFVPMVGIHFRCLQRTN